MEHTANFTTNETIKLCALKKGREQNEFFASVLSGGTFDGATFALNLSNDGTTFIPATDQSGTQYTTTSSDSVNISLGIATPEVSTWALYGTTTNAGTSTDINITVLDNR